MGVMVPPTMFAASREAATSRVPGRSAWGGTVVDAVIPTGEYNCACVCPFGAYDGIGVVSYDHEWYVPSAQTNPPSRAHQRLIWNSIVTNKATENTGRKCLQVNYKWAHRGRRTVTISTATPPSLQAH